MKPENENLEESQESLEEQVQENQEKEGNPSDEKKDEKLFEIIKELEAEKQKLKEDYLRAHAEMENVRRRSIQEIEKTSKFAIKGFAKDMLAVADNLSRALSSLPKEGLDEENEQIKNLVTGVEMTQKELLNIFERNKIKKIESVGEVFDPNYHQVVQQQEDASKPEGTIINEFQTGYMIGDRILREAMVVVSKGGPQKKELDNPPGNKVDTEA